MCEDCNEKFCQKNHLKDHICDQNSKKLHAVKSEKKRLLNLFSTKAYKCSEETNLNK